MSKKYLPLQFYTDRPFSDITFCKPQGNITKLAASGIEF